MAINSSAQNRRGGYSKGGFIVVYSTAEEMMDPKYQKYIISTLQHELNHSIQYILGNGKWSSPKFNSQRRKWNNLIFGSEESINNAKWQIAYDNQNDYQTIARGLYYGEILKLIPMHIPIKQISEMTFIPQSHLLQMLLMHLTM